MRIKFAITLTIDKPKDEDLTVDLVGTHHDIPAATYGAGFQLEDKKRGVNYD